MARPLGVCTWTFGDIPLREICERLAALSFDGVELLGDLTLYSAGEAERVLGDHGLKPFSLTPENVDLAHPDEKVRQEAVDYYFYLLDFAAGLGQPLVSCHGYVGRVKPMATMAEEYDWLVGAVQKIASQAQKLGLSMVFEVLNRYESHLVNSGAEALALLNDVGQDNLSVLLDAYHMNIEEPVPAETIRQVGERLGLYHMADSNRQAIGRGHTDFGAQLWALEDIGYVGPIIFECTAPGPDPFTPIKDNESRTWLEKYLAESRSWF